MMKPIDLEKLMLTSKQTCFFYSITKTTLSNWNGKGFPKNGRNQYPLVRGFRWAQENVFSESSDELRAARLRREKAKAWREELLAEEKAGELLPKDEVITHMNAHVLLAKHGFMNLPYRMAPVVATITDEKEAFHVLKNEVWGILRRFAEDAKLFEKELQRLVKGGNQ